jgi:hypothetical protein
MVNHTAVDLSKNVTSKHQVNLNRSFSNNNESHQQCEVIQTGNKNNLKNSVNLSS